MTARDVLGGALETCCTPMTGFYRDGNATLVGVILEAISSVRK